MVAVGGLVTAVADSKDSAVSAVSRELALGPLEIGGASAIWNFTCIPWWPSSLSLVCSNACVFELSTSERKSANSGSNPRTSTLEFAEMGKALSRELRESGLARPTASMTCAQRRSTGMVPDGAGLEACTDAGASVSRGSAPDSASASGAGTGEAAGARLAVAGRLAGCGDGVGALAAGDKAGAGAEAEAEAEIGDGD